MLTTTAPMTAAEFARLPDGDRYELIDGELVDREMSNLPTNIGGQLYRRLDNWCENGTRGRAVSDNSSFRCFPRRPNRVRKPDAAWFSAGRWSPALLGPPHFEIAPDLLVEVLSPNDVAVDVSLKVNEFFRAGTLEAWVVHPDTRQIEWRWADGRARWHEAAEPLEGAPLLPGFALALAEVFAALGLPAENPAA